MKKILYLKHWHLIFFLFIFQFIGALLSGSIALLAESIHSLSDVLGLATSYIVEIVVQKDPNYNMTYGYTRLRVLGGIVNIILILSGSFYILYKAIIRLQTGDIHIDSQILFIVGIFGILINIISAMFLHDFQSINTKGAYLHLILDAIGSSIIVFSAVLIYLTNYTIIDIISSLIILIIVFYSIKDMLKESLKIIVQYSPYDVRKIEKELGSIEGVIECHHTHVWSLDSNKKVLSTHIIIKNKNLKNMKKIRRECKKVLNKKYDINHTTIQIELEKDRECYNC